MRAVVQRVSLARVHVDGAVVGEIGNGLLIFLGVEKGDTEDDLNYIASKVASLRIFYDDAGRMNLDVKEVSGGVLVVSQFTLMGDCRKGRRPSFDAAEEPAKAKNMYEAFAEKLKTEGIGRVEKGVFGADMKVELTNDGPVTMLLDSRKIL